MTGFISRKWTLTAATFVVIAALLLLRLYFYRHTPVLQARVEPRSLAAGDALAYADTSQAATSWLWEFGEGHTSQQQRGTFRYAHAGTYLVRLTTNDGLRDTFTVHVRLPRPRPSSLQLIGPTEGYQDEKLAFEAVGGSARRYNWQFGESGHIDATEASAIYTYAQPGTYTVELQADNGRPLRQQVRIVPRTGAFTAAPVGPMTPADNIRWRLQRIANGKQVNRQYQYLLTRYLCGQANVPVVVGELPSRDFYAYCMSLQFDPGWTIDSVAVSPPLGEGCLSKLTISQHKSE